MKRVSSIMRERHHRQIISADRRLSIAIENSGWGKAILRYETKTHRAGEEIAPKRRRKGRAGGGGGGAWARGPPPIVWWGGSGRPARGAGCGRGASGATPATTGAGAGRRGRFKRRPAALRQQMKVDLATAMISPSMLSSLE